MKQVRQILVDLPTPLLMKIDEIANEEKKSAEEVITDLLHSTLSHADESRLQLKPQSPDSENGGS